MIVNIFYENKEPKFDGNKLGYLLKITVSHNDLNLLKEFVEKSTNSNNSSGTIDIYNSRHHGYWDSSNKIYAQSLENIFLPVETKELVIKHIDSFLENKDRYLSFGRVYKLCFLFTGVPGSGKSSFIKCIAKHYNRSIYVLSLSKKLDDEALNTLIAEIKEESILVLEDIDSFFVDRDPKDINVSFSSILNMFDGLFSPSNGTILFMTANNPDRLDHALIRPGRVDKIVKFDYPRKKEILQAFGVIVGNTEHFDQFYKSINGSKISMAAIVDYLFRHPLDYLECIVELNEHTQLLGEITEKGQSFYK